MTVKIWEKIEAFHFGKTPGDSVDPYINSNGNLGLYWLPAPIPDADVL